MKLKGLKKVVVCCLAGVMTLGSLAGCAGGGGTDDGHIVMTYFYGTKMPQDIDMVEQAVSDYCEEKIGVSVEFYPISVMDQDYKRIVGVDELDVMCISFGDPLTYIEMEMISYISEDDLNTYAPDIMEENKDYDMLVRDASGEVFGIATRETGVASGGSYVVRRSSLEACPWTDADAEDVDGDGKTTLADKYPDQAKIDYDDLREIFAAIKENDCDPGEYPIFSSKDDSGYFVAFDPLGNISYRSTGVLNFGDGTKTQGNTTIVNYYETDEFVEYCKFMKECVDNGWMSSETLTSPQSSADVFKYGNTKGIWLSQSQVMRDEWTIRAEEPCVQLQFLTPYYVPYRASGNIWSICGTSNKIASSLKFLNLLWSDKTLVNMVQWGIEGVHYKVVDEENNFVTFADGLNESNSGFYMPGGFYGDKNLVYTYVSTDESVLSREQQIASRNGDIETAEKAAQYSTEAGNFVYDTSKYKIEIGNMEGIIKEYVSQLTCGNYSDSLYNTFIRQMKDAGIEEIMADKQQQLDAYLANLQ